MTTVRKLRVTVGVSAIALILSIISALVISIRGFGGGHGNMLLEFLCILPAWPFLALLELVGATSALDGYSELTVFAVLPLLPNLSFAILAGFYFDRRRTTD